MRHTKLVEWRWLAMTSVAGVLAGVNLGACTIGEIPIGGDVGQAGDDGTGGTSGTGGSSTETGGTSGSGASGGTTDLTGGTGNAPGAGGTSTGGTGTGGTLPIPAGCEPQDVRSKEWDQSNFAVHWTGTGCQGFWFGECEGADCNNLAPSFEECANAHKHCFDNAACTDERKTMRDLVNANKTCTVTDDCLTVFAGCGVTEDDCTGAVYVNHDYPVEAYERAVIRLDTCSLAFEGTFCGNCERASRPPTCIEGLCLADTTCELEANELRLVINQNNACDSDDDCVQEFVGCEVTQDDCTGAVYLAADFDKPAFEAARAEYYACKGVESCGSCLRTVAPPACVAGFCQTR